LLVSSVALANVPFWGAKTSMPVETDPASLKPGQFIWDPDASPSGPIVVVVSLTEQRADVYRNGISIGVTTVSTGRRGHKTPTGVFTILQKDKDHHSSIYHNAAMPYTERLTWGGVALHAGGLPGYPSSHGCVHLPSQFAKNLFEVSPIGMTVVVADKTSAPRDVAYPPVISPVDPATGAPVEETPLPSGEEFRWQPEKSPQGPLTILVSGADRMALVYRNGIEIGRARLMIDDGVEPLGTHVFVAQKRDSKVGGTAPSRLRWNAVAVPGHAGEDNKPLDPNRAAHVHVPASFRSAVREILQPGVSMMVTDASVSETTTGVPLTVITGDPQSPPESRKSDS